MEPPSTILDPVLRYRVFSVTNVEISFFVERTFCQKKEIDVKEEVNTRFTLTRICAEITPLHYHHHHGKTTVTNVAMLLI